jgi:hypothetical protein
VAGQDAQDLHSLAQEFLDACVDSLDTIPTFAPGLAGAPERNFISPGAPVDDCCDQLTVHVSAITEAATGSGGLQAGRRATESRVNLVRLVATIKRCIPTIGSDGQFPNADELEEAAAQLDADAWALWNHIYNLIRTDELFTLCGQVNQDGIQAVAPSGGCAGFTMTVRVGLDGYEE